MLENIDLIISNPAINVPNVLPKLAKATTNSIFVTLFFLKPLNVFKSVFKLSKSATVGLDSLASKSPANHPAANKGFKEVNGAHMNAVNADSKCPPAIITPMALNDPLIKIQDFI